MSRDDAQSRPNGYSAHAGKTRIANNPSPRAALIGPKDRAREIGTPPPPPPSSSTVFSQRTLHTTQSPSSLRPHHPSSGKLCRQRSTDSAATMMSPTIDSWESSSISHSIRNGWTGGSCLIQSAGDIGTRSCIIVCIRYVLSRTAQHLSIKIIHEIPEAAVAECLHTMAI